MEDFWTRVRRNQGPRQSFGSFLYDDWGKVPQLTETMGGPQSGGGDQGNRPITVRDTNPWQMSDYTQPISYMPTTQGAPGQRFLAEWAYGGDQLGGGQYVNGGWQHGAPIAAGTDLGTLGIATSTGYRLPVGYDSRQDTFRGELNGRQGETSWSRAIRKAQDMVINGQADWDTAIQQAIQLVNQEAAAAGLTTGFGAAGGSNTVRGPGDWNYQGDETSMAKSPQPQEGNGVVSPLNDPRTPQQIQQMRDQVSGSPSGQQLGTPTAPGAGSTSYNQYLQNNKVGRMAELLTRLGLGTPQRQRSFVGSTLANVYTDLFDPWMQTQGATGGNVADNFSNLMDQFTGYMQGPGGMGAIAGDANQAINAIAQGGSPYAQGLGDTELFGLLKGFNQLANTPKNPWLQQAYGNLSDDALFTFAQQQGQKLKGGGVDDATAQTLLQFLQSDPRFGFLVGR